MANPLRDFFGGWWAGFKMVGESFTIAFNAFFLTIAYVVGVGITAMVAKVVRKHFLDLGWPANRQTHWVENTIKTERFEKYRRQF